MSIEQKTTFLTSVLKRIRRGELVPAAFQRPYVWQRQDVEALCDSLLSEFPLGSIVTWIPDGSNKDISLGLGRRRLGPAKASNDEPAEALLLDGQNRLASLAWMMRKPTDPLPEDMTHAETAIWDNGEVLMCDVNTRSMRFMSREEAETSLAFPVWTVLGDEESIQCIRDLWKGPWKAFEEKEVSRALKWYDEVRGAVFEAKIVETCLDRMPLEEARHAFLRVCRVGVPMSDKDFDEATRWTPPGEESSTQKDANASKTRRSTKHA